MRKSLSHRVRELEKYRGRHEGTEILTFADGHTVEIPKYYFQSLVADIRAGKRSTLPIHHDPD